MHFRLLLFILVFSVLLGPRLKRHFLIRLFADENFDEKTIVSFHRYFRFKKDLTELWIELSFWFYFLKVFAFMRLLS